MYFLFLLNYLNLSFINNLLSNGRAEIVFGVVASCHKYTQNILIILCPVVFLTQYSFFSNL